MQKNRSSQERKTGIFLKAPESQSIIVAKNVAWWVRWVPKIIAVFFPSLEERCRKASVGYVTVCSEKHRKAPADNASLIAINPEKKQNQIYDSMGWSWLLKKMHV